MYSKLIEITTYGPMKLHSIRQQLEQTIEESGIKLGVMWVGVKGATPAFVVIEKGYEDRLLEVLCKLIPFSGWRHGNAYAHLMSTVLKTSLIIPIENGKMLLSKDHEVYLLETRPVYNHRRIIAVNIHGV